MKKHIKSYLDSDWVLLSLMLVIFLFLGVYNLGEKSFFIDEIDNALKSSRPLIDVFGLKFSKIFCLFLHFWLKYFPLNEFSVRLPAVIFGAASVIAVFYLGKLLFGRKIAYLSALLLAISPLFMVHSRMALANSAATFLSLVQIYFFWRILSSNRITDWIFYALISIAAVFNHEAVFLIIAVEFIFLIFMRRGLLGKWLILFLSMAVPVFIFLPDSSLRIMRVVYMWGAHTSSFVFGIKDALYGLYVLCLGMNILPWKLFITIPALFLYALLFMFGLIKLRRSPEKLFFMLLYLFLPLFILGFNNIIFIPRQVVFLAPVFCLIVSFGTINIRSRFLRISAICLIIAFSCYGLMNYYLNRQFQWGSYVEPYRDVAQYLAGHFNPATDVVVLPDEPSGANAVPLVYYTKLFFKGNPRSDSVYFLYNRQRILVKSRPGLFMLYQQMAGKRRIWYVDMNHPYYVSQEDRKLISKTFRDWLAANYHLDESRNFLVDIDAKDKRLYSGKLSVPDYRAKVELYYIN